LRIWNEIHFTSLHTPELPKTEKLSFRPNFCFIYNKQFSHVYSVNINLNRRTRS